MDLSIAGAVTVARRAFYFTNKACVLQVSIETSKEVFITIIFSLPLQISYIINPYRERIYWVFDISFSVESSYETGLALCQLLSPVAQGRFSCWLSQK